MPIHEYECHACGHRFEKLQKVNDAALRVCPACGEPELIKLVSAVAFRLKGGGWYETDFKSGNKKNVLHGAEAGSDASHSSDSAGGDSASSTSSSDSSTGSSSKEDSGKSSKKAASDGKSGDGGHSSNTSVAAS